MGCCAFCDWRINSGLDANPRTNTYVCTACQKYLTPNSVACQRCKIPLPKPLAKQTQTQNKLLCKDCKKESPPWAHILCPLVYQYPVSAAIRTFKFQKQVNLGKALIATFTREIANYYSDQVFPTQLVSVPVHPKRLKERGFDTSNWLLKRISKKISVPICAQALTKYRYTQAQNSLTRIDRMKNLNNSFKLNLGADLCGEHVAIFDDVMTTGTTIKELCKLIQTQNPASIHVWCLARTPTNVVI